MTDTPRIGEQIKVVASDEPALAEVGEVVRVVQVERSRSGVYVYVDGRAEFRRFLWSVTPQRGGRVFDD